MGLTPDVLSLHCGSTHTVEKLCYSALYIIAPGLHFVKDNVLQPEAFKMLGTDCHE